MASEINSEDDLQIAFMNWLLEFDPAIHAITFHVPNGGFRRIWEAKKLKRMGVKPGVPDLFIPLPSQGYHGLFIELKWSHGHASPQQRTFMAGLSAKGYACRVCYTLDACTRVLLNYLNIGQDDARYIPIQNPDYPTGIGCNSQILGGRGRAISSDVCTRDPGRNLPKAARGRPRKRHLSDGDTYA